MVSTDSTRATEWACLKNSIFPNMWAYLSSSAIYIIGFLGGNIELINTLQKIKAKDL